ncbi:Plasma kallikrein-like protein [Leptotrombidium deliense]|uniref:Plasma kallikrein-like protein n=1 Tax=Leptotrombidium deliense TaxID=299467 RepID=A0A443SDU2_9ACAR|nr:Plasma kallikrein-like protein [Leptotrombidium deliense]
MKSVSTPPQEQKLSNDEFWIRVCVLSCFIVLILVTVFLIALGAALSSDPECGYMPVDGENHKNICSLLPPGYCFQVVAGSGDLLNTEYTTVHRVLDVYPLKSEKDGAYSLFTDVALLLVYPSIAYRAHTDKIRGITSVCLPNSEQTVLESRGDIVGFGISDEFNRIRENKLQTTNLPIIHVDNCIRMLENDPSDWNADQKSSLVCVNVKESRSACSGDSGGPLVVKRKNKIVQIGVATAVSFTGCGDRQNIYNSVTFHRKWIKRITGV